MSETLTKFSVDHTAFINQSQRFQRRFMTLGAIEKWKGKTALI